MLEVALTVFIYGAVVAGALLTMFTVNYLDALAKRAKAQAETEARLNR